MRKSALVPGRWQSMAELSYVFIAGLLKDTVGNEGRPYFPFIFTIFMFVLFGNLLGMVPYSFTFTSHIAVTFAMGIVCLYRRHADRHCQAQDALLLVLYATGCAHGDGTVAGAD